jgi:hypothetical protein
VPAQVCYTRLLLVIEAFRSLHKAAGHFRLGQAGKRGLDGFEGRCGIQALSCDHHNRKWGPFFKEQSLIRTLHMVAGRLLLPEDHVSMQAVGISVQMTPSGPANWYRVLTLVYLTNAVDAVQFYLTGCCPCTRPRRWHRGRGSAPTASRSSTGESAGGYTAYRYT